MKQRSWSRRRFTGTALLAAGPLVVPGRVLGLDGGVAPSERIVVAGLGIGSRGRQVMRDFLQQPDVQVVEICDVQESRRSYAKAEVDGHYGNRDCRVTRDFYETLERPGVDAVLVATGDRWHALASALAAHAGLDVYCEKPCAMTIGEARAMARVFEARGRVFQAGTQRRSVENFQYAADLARSGRLGQLKTLHASILEPSVEEWDPGVEDEPDPSVVDWDRWLGPSPWVPYHSSYLTQWNRHPLFAAAFGIPDWGVHTLDLCQWAADADDTAPVEFEPGDEGSIMGKYANGLRVVLRRGGFANEGDWLGLGTCPVRFEGDEGWVEAGDSGRMEASSESLLEGFAGGSLRGTDASAHVRDFLDAVRHRGRTRCDAEITRRGHNACQAAAIAWRLGRRVVYDPENESFPEDAEAEAMRERALREPWAYPGE